MRQYVLSNELTAQENFLFHNLYLKNSMRLFRAIQFRSMKFTRPISLSLSKELGFHASPVFYLIPACDTVHSVHGAYYIAR